MSDTVRRQPGEKFLEFQARQRAATAERREQAAALSSYADPRRFRRRPHRRPHWGDPLDHDYSMNA